MSIEEKIEILLDLKPDHNWPRETKRWWYSKVLANVAQLRNSAEYLE